MMKVRVLGCSGAIAKDCRTTSFLIDGDVLVDAGTGVGDLTLDEMGGIDHVLLTHSHLDHVAALPLMVDAIASQLTKPDAGACAWPAPSRRSRRMSSTTSSGPTSAAFRRPRRRSSAFTKSGSGRHWTSAGKHIEVLPAVHTVPAVRLRRRPRARAAGSSAATPSATRPSGARVNQMNVAALVIETAFSNREQDLAQRSLHLSPHALAEELDCIDKGKRFPIYITHTKPAETELIMSEIQKFDQTQPFGPNVVHDIRWLRAGQEFDL